MLRKKVHPNLQFGKNENPLDNLERVSMVGAAAASDLVGDVVEVQFPSSQASKFNPLTRFCPPPPIRNKERS